jgi:hypothetical protein
VYMGWENYRHQSVPVVRRSNTRQTSLTLTWTMSPTVYACFLERREERRSESVMVDRAAV